MQTQGYNDGGSSLALPGLTPVVKRLMIGLGAIWLATVVLDLINPSLILSVGLNSGEYGGLFAYLGATPGVWFDQFPFVFPWQVLSYGFLHSVGSPLHLLFNLLALYFFGTMIEGTIGSRRFLQFFLVCVAVGGAVSLVTKPFVSGTGPTVGASAGVLGILCCAAVMRPQSTVLFFFFPIPLAWLAIGFVVIDVFGLIQQLAGRFDSYKDHVAHLAGAAFGFVAARRQWIWSDWSEDLKATVEQKVADKRESDRAQEEQQLDELLVKIQNEGLTALSDREREFLKRMSNRS